MKYGIAFFLAALLSPGAAPQDPPKKVNAVATLGIMKWIVQEIGGDRVAADVLANPAQDPHYVSPSPDLQKKAGAADLFIQLGRGLDIWSKNILDASGNPKVQSGQPGHCLCSSNCSVEELPKEVSREWGDIHPEGNPHIWLDPLNVKTMAENIAEALKRVDPAGAETYQKRLEALLLKLDQALFGEALIEAVGAKRVGVLERRLKGGDLDQYLESKGLKDKLGGWLKRAAPIKGMKVVSYHKTYAYFESRFGIKIVAELEERPGLPPPPSYRDQMVDLVKREGIKAILNDNFYSKAAAEYVADKTGAKVLVTMIDVGAGEEVSDYFKLVDRLIDQLAQANK